MENSSNNRQYKYFAFISYNSEDLKWGKRLQHKLENYRMPSTLCSERGWERTPIRPIFFAPTDIQPGMLPIELQERLIASRHLIVVCSPNSAKSEWVGREIEFFYSLGRSENIHFFIVEGEPLSEDPKKRCFHNKVKELGLQEVLGANINEKIYRWSWLNKERAYVQLITKLLEVEFDSIWKRHKRKLVAKMLSWFLGTLLVVTAIVGVWFNSRSVEVGIGLQEVPFCNNSLPPIENAVITMELENETKCDTLGEGIKSTVFHNVPQRFIDKEVRVKCHAKNFIGIDTVMRLKNNISLEIRRDTAIYGKIIFCLYDIDADKPLGNREVVIDGRKTSTDSQGFVRMYIPLEQQKEKYGIVSDIPLNVEYITMPCNRNTVITPKYEE